MFAYNVEKFTFDNLSSNSHDLSKYWKERLVSKIPFLEERVLMLADNYFFRELASVEGEPLTAPTHEVMENLKTSLLAMELLSGWEYIRDELNGDYPMPFLFALLETFEGAQLWINDIGEVDRMEYLALFFGSYTENKVLQIRAVESKTALPDEFKELGDFAVSTIESAKLPQEVEDELIVLLEADLTISEIRETRPIMH